MKKIYFYNKEGEKLVGVLHKPKKKSNIGIVMVHGFTGSKDGHFTSGISKRLEKDFKVLRFDFSGNGESEGKFEDQCYSKYIEELHVAIQLLKSKGIKEVYVIGHSLGAVIALYEYNKYKDVNKIVFIAPAFHLKVKFMSNLLFRFFITLIKGNVEFTDYFGNKIKLKRKFFTERFITFNKNKALNNLKISAFAILAEKDRSINNKKCEKLFKKYNIKYIIIKESAHNFREEKYLNQVAKEILKWLK